ncbi:hypothetical protein RND71_042402 [Anisodus tanguticus]|uniref:Retrovirus-related Pol polyprotein from transposon TNT 1-94-like beta-barrel domain-containing protein n=1 Tax=Anisodus tanguticus TaxID=243964 RepID=A0AAE1UUL5_9SOLA|nr:hypothetical protein RND71_042402 [Anisodus tanguticus]
MSINNSHSWVLDTVCGSHICTNVQGLTDSRKVEPREVDLRVGNGARVDAERVGTYRLNLPSGYCLVLNDCYYVPSLTRNIISIPVLDMEDFSSYIYNGSQVLSFDNVIYGTAPLVDGLYTLNCSREIFNV